jgi:hypothetical protein
VAANVGIFAQVRNPAIVPDMFLSLDVEVAEALLVQERQRTERLAALLRQAGIDPEQA